ncbi:MULTISPECIES: hypothetical protein [Nocardia]|uniref:hypothetical protein n=1 Tax=Nocardia TaxID=1817 RepID=UPI000D68D500|nr:MULTISPECIES: hypothetical protein [Nocardia]
MVGYAPGGLRPGGQAGEAASGTTGREFSPTAITGTVICLALVLLAAVVGTVIAFDTAATIRAENVGRIAVSATLTEYPHRATPPDRRFRAQVEWTVDGRTARATVLVPHDATRGSQVTVWLDANGSPVGPPRDAWHAAMAGVGCGAVILSVPIWGALVLGRSVRRSEACGHGSRGRGAGGGRTAGPERNGSHVLER